MIAPMRVGGLVGGGGASPPGMGWTFRRGRAWVMKSCQMPAGAPPPVTFLIGVLSSLPTQTAVTKPPV